MILSFQRPDKRKTAFPAKISIIFAARQNYFPFSASVRVSRLPPPLSPCFWPVFGQIQLKNSHKGKKLSFFLCCIK
jgi:hypothetical protein